RHLVAATDVSAFLALLPDWRELSLGLQRVVLDDDVSCFGWHRPTTIALCAWPAGLGSLLGPAYHQAPAAISLRPGVPSRSVVLPEDATCPHCHSRIRSFEFEVCSWCDGSLLDAYRDADADADGVQFLAEFTEATAQAFLLVHVLVHELGHHHDRM